MGGELPPYSRAATSKRTRPTLRKGDGAELPANFQDALLAQLARHGDTVQDLCTVLSRADRRIKVRTVHNWAAGVNVPHREQSWAVLGTIEGHYRLPHGYFRSIVEKHLTARDTAVLKQNRLHRELLRWHLPDDFDSRSVHEQEEIVRWFHENILKTKGDYAAHLKKITKHPFAINFPTIQSQYFPPKPHRHRVGLSTIKASPQLDNEITELVKFKTSALTVSGFRREATWGNATARIRINQFGLLLGALAAAPNSEIAGLGISPPKLTIGLLLIPAIWDWWLLWRERRRGFFIDAERNILYEARSLTDPDRGWIAKHPKLAKRIFAIPGIISKREVEEIQRNWIAACKATHHFLGERIKDVGRVKRRNRDPFEAILPILNADSPLSEYKKIADEIMKRMPDEADHPRDAAKAVRAYLIMRFCMHSGLRQRNLRELLFCPKHSTPKHERKLEALNCGELRWDPRASGWEIFIPATAFKNAHSSFFAKRPYRLLLPDRIGLYSWIEAYIERHRNVLLRQGKDSGTFFVRNALSKNEPAAYDVDVFYAEYRRTIQLYGIFNPYTGRGAIASLMPHGPNCARDILATHVVKATGSYVEASYAIQSTPLVVERHYARFLPKDKTAHVAHILNKVWANSD